MEIDRHFAELESRIESLRPRRVVLDSLAGYGAMIACLGLGALGGTVAAARATNIRKPGVVTYCVYLGEGTP